MCQDPKKIRDLVSPGSGILEDLDDDDWGLRAPQQLLEDIGSYIFIFPWDLRDPGSCHGKIAVGS